MILDVVSYIGGVLGVFLVWTFCIYWLHRAAHIHSSKNPLWLLHSHHHKTPYFDKDRPRKPKALGYLFWFEDWQSSLDVVLVMTMPLLILCYFFPEQGLPILVFHYIYESTFSEDFLDHNPNVTGKKTIFFAWGTYHLLHHHKFKCNYCLMINLWDWVFGTAEMPPEGFPVLRGSREERLKARAERKAALLSSAKKAKIGESVDDGDEVNDVIEDEVVVAVPGRKVATA